MVHAAFRGSSRHEAAARLVARGLEERRVYCIAPQNLTEFAAVTTRGRLVSPALSADRVRDMTRRLFESRTLVKIYPMRGTVMRALMMGTQLGVTGPAWYDLFLAVTMLDAGVTGIATDNLRDFAKLPQIEAIDIETEARDL